MSSLLTSVAVHKRHTSENCISFKLILGERSLQQCRKYRSKKSNLKIELYRNPPKSDEVHSEVSTKNF